MRFVLGFLSGVLGGLVGWAGLAYVLILVFGPDREGGVAMAAFFDYGPIGGIVGFLAGIWLFSKLGFVRSRAPRADGAVATAPAAPRLSRLFAVVVVAACLALGFWGWWEFIRSPYLSHGAEGLMSLRLQFRLPPGVDLPADGVVVAADDGDGQSVAVLAPNWRAKDGGRALILAAVELSQKTYGRRVRLEWPGVGERIWRLGLGSDPYPIAAFSPWRSADDNAGPAIEMRFRLTADRCAVCE